MFYDLNVQWNAHDPDLPRTIAFLHELGYNVVALNHTIAGKLPVEPTCPIPNPLPYKDIPPKLEILRRVTLVLTEAYQNARLAALAKQYDVLAVRPVDERTLQLACTSLECDIISLDLTQNLQFHFKYKMLAEAVREGKRIEICYSQALLGDAQGRRNLISNATQLIRASRGRGLLLSSDAKETVGCRGPWDVINLAALWGLGQERGHDSMTKDARNTVVMARLKSTGYRGVIDVVHGGEKPTTQEMDDSKQQISEQRASKKKEVNKKRREKKKEKQLQVVAGQKRKAEAAGSLQNDLEASNKHAKK